jgi:hypothetical protein
MCTPVGEPDGVSGEVVVNRTSWQQKPTSSLAKETKCSSLLMAPKRIS